MSGEDITAFDPTPTPQGEETMVTLYELVTQLSEALEQDERDNGETFVRLAEGSPQWMTDVIHEAHGDKLPDDTTYRFIQRVADHLVDDLEEDGDEEDATEALRTIEPDVYTSDLTAWLHARNDHVFYLSEASSEFGPMDGFQLLSVAQQMHIQEVGDALIRALVERVDDPEMLEEEE